MGEAGSLSSQAFPMARINSLSLRIGIIHVSIVGLCAGLFLSPLGTRPGPMHVVLMLPFFYCLLSFIPALVGAVIGVAEIFRKPSKTQPMVGLCLNVAYLTLFFGVVAFMWDAWTGI